MQKVVLISLYFGKLPNYFLLTLESMKRNRDFTYLMLIDDKTEYEWGDNIKVIYTSFQEIQKLIQSKFEFPIKLEKPYKLCDYKPAYGYIFAEYIKEYDFWGHVDLDLIWGNLKAFITEDILNQYEFIYREGALRLYKNKERINRLFEERGSVFGYQEVFSNEVNYCFDESFGIQRIAEKNGVKIYENDDTVADIDAFSDCLQIRCVKKKKWKKEAGIFRSIKNYEHQLFKWENGKIIRYFVDENNKIGKDEFLYLHLLKRKMNYSQKINNQNNAFMILPRGFVQDEELTVPRLKELSAVTDGRLKESVVQKIMRKLKKMWNMPSAARNVTIRTRLYFIIEKFVG